jgi:soluble lytic murein transglycosylase
MYDQALEGLAKLRRGKVQRGEDPKARQATLDLEEARILLKRDEPAKALAVLQRRAQGTKPSRTARNMTAECLGRLGRVDEAIQHWVPVPTGKTPTSSQIKAQARLLAKFGRYKEAMKLIDELAARLSKKHGPRLLLKHAWLAYRAGKYDQAIRGFRHLAKNRRRDKAYALYWEGRAHAKAGRAKEAEALYRQLLEDHLRTYYGLQARSRLVEAGKLSLADSSKCDNYAEPEAPNGDPRVPELVAKMAKRYGSLFPSLRRIRTLWKLGMMVDARRELSLIAFDFAWIKARGRPRWFVIRPEVARIWRGSAPARRRWNRWARKVYKERAALGPQLGELLDRAGIFFYGWKFSPRHPDPVRQAHPRGYPSLVVRMAKKHKLDPNLVWAVMRTESAFRTDAVSRAGAAGLMQIMPVTARRIARERKLDGFYLAKMYDPETNIDMAAWYLRQVSDKFKGQLMLLAAAYNGGPHNVARWIDERGKGAAMDEFIEEIPFAESRRYGKKILRLAALYERVHCNKDDRIATNKLDLLYSQEPSY